MQISCVGRSQMAQHTPPRCKDCHHIDIPYNSYPLISIELNGGPAPKKFILDTGHPQPYVLISKETYDELLPFTRIFDDSNEGKKILEDLIDSSIGGITIEREDIMGVLRVKFSLPGDKKYEIARSVFTYTLARGKAQGLNIIGLDALRKDYIIIGDSENEDSLKIALLPNKGLGYICRGVSEIACSHNPENPDE